MTRLLIGGAFAIALMLFSSQTAQAQYVTYSYSVGYAPPVAPVVVARPAVVTPAIVAPAVVARPAVVVRPTVVARPYIAVPRPVAVFRPAPILTPVRSVARPVVRATTYPFRPRLQYRYGY
ncbi:MAG: hypothetical protein AAFU85_14220 [Planctomycetota bacterium]